MWQVFDDLIKSSSPGNDGNIGFFFEEVLVSVGPLPDHVHQAEIIPLILSPGVSRFNANDEKVDAFPKPEVPCTL